MSSQNSNLPQPGQEGIKAIHVRFLDVAGSWTRPELGLNVRVCNPISSSTIFYNVSRLLTGRTRVDTQTDRALRIVPLESVNR